MEVFRPYLDYDKLLGQNGTFLRSLPESERTRHRCSIALTNTAHAFPYVPTAYHTEEMCLYVAERCPVYFPLMLIQTPPIIRAALKLANNYFFIRVPNGVVPDEYLDLAIRNGGAALIKYSARRHDIEYLASIINDNPRVLEYIESQPEELVRAALARDVTLYKVLQDKDRYLDLFLTCLEQQFGVPVLHAGPEMIWPEELRNGGHEGQGSPSGQSSTGGSVRESPGPVAEETFDKAVAKCDGQSSQGSYIHIYGRDNGSLVSADSWVVS